jgi:DNA-binding IclR family transcriptional regulator
MTRPRARPLRSRLSDPNRGAARGPGEKGEDTQFVTALARGLDVLRAFEDRPTPLGNREISAATGLPRPTVSRLTYTLARLGFLDHDAGAGKYRPGVGAVSLGYQALAALPLRREARSAMQSLADRSACSVQLWLRDRLHLVCIEACTPVRDFADSGLQQTIGTRVPLTPGGVGRALLAGLPRAERLYVLEHLERRLGADWPAAQMSMYEALAEYQRDGVTLSRPPKEPRSSALGVPVFLPKSGHIMALTCPIEDTDAAGDFAERRSLIGARLARLAARLSALD